MKMLIRLVGVAMAMTIAAPFVCAQADPKPGTNTGFECLLEASVEVNLGSPVDGVVAQVFAERGSPVRKGQPLVKLNDRVEAATVALARGKAEFARRRASRNDELYQKQLISVQERDQLETEARLAELELAEREELLRLRTIHSPINGVIADRFVAAGDQVLRATGKIMRLLQLDPLHAEVVAPASLFGTIRSGAEAEVTLAGRGGAGQRARVTAVDRMIDAASGTFRVRLQVPNPGFAIPAGLRCQVKFQGR
jgi:membrane fusion protein (multidrug efflux system)